MVVSFWHNGSLIGDPDTFIPSFWHLAREPCQTSAQLPYRLGLKSAMNSSPQAQQWWQVWALIEETLYINISLVASHVFFLFFGLHSVEQCEKWGRLGNTYHVNDVWWTYGGRGPHSNTILDLVIEHSINSQDPIRSQDWQYSTSWYEPRSMVYYMWICSWVPPSPTFLRTGHEQPYRAKWWQQQGSLYPVCNGLLLPYLNIDKPHFQAPSHHIWSFIGIQSTTSSYN